MTSPVTPRALLTVRFDVDQISQQLSYKLDRLLQDQRAAQDPDDGIYAGALYFVRGEEVDLRIVATGGEDLSKIEAIESCFITNPQIIQCGHKVPTIYSAPSMFVKERDQPAAAVYLLNGHFKASEEPSQGGRKTLFLDWDRTAQVTTDDGRWELSFYLTVRIVRKDRTELRVFSFDPETQVGDPMSPPG